jgi:hypothetical protein
MDVAPSRMPADPASDKECINTLRFLSVDAVQKLTAGTLECQWALRQWHMCCGL